MSVFRGSIAEYPGVVVDHFISANCERGRVFFLSHCHKDHMTGLSSSAILNALQRYRTHLYCSEVTCSLLLKDPDFTQLSPYLKGLPMDEPVSMTLETCGLLNEKLNFTVTLLPAGHCPGSSMFFFQGCRGNVLYTGDFRLTLDETKRLRALHCGESLLGITTLYVDTTFCHPIATDIPSRETSRDLILKLIESWLAKSPANVVHLQQCAIFGYEHLYMGVHKKFKSKIHIAAWRINAYREISAVIDCLTTDGESTRIHACNFRRGQKGRPGLPCGSCERGGVPNVLRVKPSTQWFLFNKMTTSQPCVFLPQFNMFRVIHSMHASYSELQQFITYIRPKRIVPCVVPFGDSSLMDVCTRLKGFLPLTEVASACPEPNPTCSVSRLTVGSKSTSAKSAGYTTSTSNTTESDDDGWSTGDKSISEFTNTDDQLSTENATFFQYQNQEHQADIVALPSLLSITTTEASPPPSTDSATVGSLKQSPIDLSLGSPSSGSASQTTQTDILPTTGTKLGSTEDEEKTESSLLSCGNDKEVPDQVVERVSDDRVEDVVGAVDSEVGVAVKGRTDDWCLQYDCSPAETSIVNTPLAKRARLSETTNSVSRKLFSSKSEQRQVETSRTGKYEASGAHHAFIDLTEDEETSELTASSDCVHVCPPPQMIDLTHDHQAPSDLTHDHRAQSNLTHDHQVPSDLTRNHQVPSDLTHDHRAPSDVVRDHHAPSDVTRDHHAPSDVTRDCQVPSEPQYFLIGRTRKLADCASSNPAPTALSNAVQTSSRSMPPVVVELSDSQSTGSTVGRRSASVESGSHDPFGSPGCLPPTPGRENVTSILQRQDFP